jgi:hypothetical protein
MPINRSLKRVALHPGALHGLPFGVSAAAGVIPVPPNTGPLLTGPDTGPLNAALIVFGPPVHPKHLPAHVPHAPHHPPHAPHKPPRSPQLPPRASHQPPYSSHQPPRAPHKPPRAPHRPPHAPPHRPHPVHGPYGQCPCACCAALLEMVANAAIKVVNAICADLEKKGG